MNDTILTEVKRAKEAVNQARDYLNMADSSYIDAAIFRLNAAQAELDAICKRAKEVATDGNNRSGLTHSTQYLFS